MVYLCLLWLAIAIWIVLLALARDLGLRWTAWAAGILIALFVLAPPLLSLDLFSYISYARLGAEHGLNPYEYAPAAIPGDEAAARVDRLPRRRLRLRAAVHARRPIRSASSGSPFALWSLKVLAGARGRGDRRRSSPASRALRGVAPAGAVAFVALNPIVLVQLVGGGHNDALTAAIAMAAVGARRSPRGRSPPAPGSSLAAAIKVSGALYAPFALVGARGPGERARLIARRRGAVVARRAVSLAAFGIERHRGAQRRRRQPRADQPLERPGGPLPRQRDRRRRRSAPSRSSPSASVVAWLLVAVARGFDWVRAAGWAALGVLVASAYIVPWYLIWVLPVAAISRDRVLIGATILMTVFQAINGIPGISTVSEPRMRSSPEFDLIAAIRDRLGGPRRRGPRSGSGSATTPPSSRNPAGAAGRSASTRSSTASRSGGAGARRERSAARPPGRRSATSPRWAPSRPSSTSGSASPRTSAATTPSSSATGSPTVAEPAGAALLGGDLTGSAVLAVCGDRDRPDAGSRRHGRPRRRRARRRDLRHRRRSAAPRPG